jgi:hypothetical protein
MALTKITTGVISNNSVSLEKMATMATDSFLGRDTAGTGNVEVMSASSVRTILNVADGANNYSHPANHVASIITQDSSNRFVTDAEKTTWNAKVATGDSRLSDSRTCDNTFDSASTARTNLSINSAAETATAIATAITTALTDAAMLSVAMG